MGAPSSALRFLAHLVLDFSGALIVRVFHVEGLDHGFLKALHVAHKLVAALHQALVGGWGNGGEGLSRLCRVHCAYGR